MRPWRTSPVREVKLGCDVDMERNEYLAVVVQWPLFFLAPAMNKKDEIELTGLRHCDYFIFLFFFMIKVEGQNT